MQVKAIQNRLNCLIKDLGSKVYISDYSIDSYLNSVDIRSHVGKTLLKYIVVLYYLII